MQLGKVQKPGAVPSADAIQEKGAQDMKDENEVRYKTARAKTLELKWLEINISIFLHYFYNSL